MIISLLLDLVYTIMDIQLFFDIPELPRKAEAMIENVYYYMVDGAAILANFCNLNYLITLLGIVLVVDVAINIYKFVMWIIKKIPFLGME